MQFKAQAVISGLDPNSLHLNMRSKRQTNLKFLSVQQFLCNAVSVKIEEFPQQAQCHEKSIIDVRGLFVPSLGDLVSILLH